MGMSESGSQGKDGIVKADSLSFSKRTEIILLVSFQERHSLSFFLLSHSIPPIHISSHLPPQFQTRWCRREMIIKLKIQKSDLQHLFLRSVVSGSLNPLDYSPAFFSLHGIFQAKILEWVAISSSRGSSQPRG